MTNRVYLNSVLTLLLLQPFSLLSAAQLDHIVYGDQRISISYQATLSQQERKTTYQWLSKVTDALRTVYGELPKDNYSITIKRSSSRSGPVPWGHVERGEPTNVLLVINPELGYDALLDDWTAFHEMSHLLIPYLGHGNIWFSEGLATYYQNIIQARSGLLDETHLWEKISAGFERGKKQQSWNNITLTETSNKMKQNRQFMRVHWSGVLYWLNADVELRKQGKASLDEALRLLKNCCEHRSMSASAIAHKLDALTSSNVFVPLFDLYRESYQMPDYESILAKLGVKQPKGADNISFDDNAALATIRQKIYLK